MREITTSKGTFLFVVVPDDAENVKCHTYFNILSYLNKFKAFEIELPLGEWVKMFTTKDISNEQAENIVLCTNEESYKFFGDGQFKNYNSEHTSYFKTAKESLQSLMKAYGLDITQNHQILAKI